MKKVRILSLDGGGIRGIIPAIVILYIEEKLIEITKNPNARIADYFDMIFGTSTGGILSCFYLTPNSEEGDNNPSSKYSAAKALEFYSEKGYSIFNKSKRNEWLGLRQIFNGTKYCPKTLEKIFREEFGDLKMSELLKPCLVTTYDMKSKTAVFFSKEEQERAEKDFYVKDVVRSTSAAPTYFPPAKIKNVPGNKKFVNIDGGVFAGNPAMCAYAECRKTKFDKVDSPSAGQMLILSIGTGAGKFSLSGTDKSSNWGVINWAKSIPEIMMDGSIDTVHTQMDNLFKAMDGEFKLNYKRINVPDDKRNYSSNMADASEKNIKALKKAGQEALEAAKKSSEDQLGLDDFIQELIKNN